MCEVAKALRCERFSASLASWYEYGHPRLPASVIGRPNTAPCGGATSGAQLPREKRSLECVPRVVRTR
ncbi:Uncharacterised protein [Mycobacteroides abscessus subsp. abscessus]|nr:Uncharacterised protein [Mycobacteroides abscessus subsp. abscessus]